MFSTPNSGLSRRGGGRARRALNVTSGRTQAEDDNGSPEIPIPITTVSESTEVLTILRSLQQQVSAIQSQQATNSQHSTPQTPVEASPASSGGTPGSTKRRLPKDLVVSASFNTHIITNKLFWI